MQNKEFKVGDTVYVGTDKGKITEIHNEGVFPITILFCDGTVHHFTKYGRYRMNQPIVLKHFPYELEYKQIIPIIEKDTLVYVKIGSTDFWDMRYYSHHNRQEDKHYVFQVQLKSNDTDATIQVEEISLTNPLEK